MARIDAFRNGDSRYVAVDDRVYLRFGRDLSLIPQFSFPACLRFMPYAETEKVTKSVRKMVERLEKG